MSTMVRLTPRHHIYHAAQWWIRGLLAIAGMIFLSILGILFGFNVPAGTPPIFVFVRQHPEEALIGGGTLLLMTLLSLLIARIPPLDPHSRSRGGWTGTPPRLVFSTAISTISTLLFVGLLTLVLIRPSWCPTAICPAPLIVTNPHGVHDTNLELAFTGVQSATAVIPGDPGQYSLAHLPSTNERALQVGYAEKAVDPYRIAFNLHNLRQSGYDLIIEEVDLVVRQTNALPYPLNVWEPGSNLQYQSDVYVVTYMGERSGKALPSRNAKLPGSEVQLSSGETDEIDLQVASLYTAEVSFAIQVTYRMTNESQTHTLTLPDTFTVAFSDASNWHLYDLQGNQFVPHP